MARRIAELPPVATLRDVTTEPTNRGRCEPLRFAAVELVKSSNARGHPYIGIQDVDVARRAKTLESANSTVFSELTEDDKNANATGRQVVSQAGRHLPGQGAGRDGGC